MANTAQWPTVWGGMPPFANHPARACRSADTDLFFPEGEGAKKAAAIAKALCRRCPLVAECAAFAIPQAALRGIWGGLSEPEREQLRAGKVPPPRKVQRPPTAEETERRIAAGRAAAASRTARNLAEIVDLDASGVDVTQMMAATGHSRRTVHRYLKMARGQQAAAQPRRVAA